MFCCQLNRPPSTRFISLFSFATLLAGSISEYQVAYGGWRDQFIPPPIARQIPEELLYVFSLFELVKCIRREFTFGLGALAFAIGTMLTKQTLWSVYLSTVTTSVIKGDTIPPQIIAFYFVVEILSAAPILFIFGHWTGILLNSHKTIQIDNDRIKSPLTEKNILLDSMADFSRPAEAGGLTAAMTHEISQPLSAVALNAAVLKAHLKTMEAPPEIEALVDQVEPEISRTNDSVHHLRQIFRPVVQGHQVTAMPIDPKIVLDQILSIVISRVRQSKVSVTVENFNVDRGR